MNLGGNVLGRSMSGVFKGQQEGSGDWNKRGSRRK